MENNEEQIEDNNENIAENENKSNLNTINFGKPTIYYYNTSRDNYHSKHFNKALINIILYIKLVPNNPKAYILKGKIYLNLNQFEKSLTAFLRSEKLGEKSIDLLYGLARSYKQLHQFDQALKYYKEALAIEPNAKSYYLLAKCYYSMGKKEYAIEIYNKAIELNPNYAEAYFNKGVCLSNLNFKSEAIEMYNKTIELNPNFVDAYFQRGYCFYNLKKYQKAMVEMNKVLELDPNYYQAYYEKGFCFQKMKRYEEAIIEISKAIEQNSYFEKAYFQRGYCCEIIKDYPSAIHDYKKVIELNKHNYMVYYRLGLCYLAKNNLKDALNMFEETIKLNRANYDAYYYKGICQRYLKYYEDAIITFNFFLVCFIKNKSITDEQIANVYYNKGRCLLSLGRYDEAIQMFTNYLKKNKNSYEVYFKRAVCYYNVHKYKKAVYDLSYLIQELSKEKNKQEKDNNIINEENKKNKNKEEDNDEELWAEIYFLRSKAYINMNKIESGLNDLNKFFDLIEKEKNKIKENLVKHGDKNYDIEKILYQKYDISDAHFKRGFCFFNLLDYNSALKEFEKAIILHIIDDCWKENLRELDELKHSVQNASYEQKDPLLIFKLESVKIWDNMIDELNNRTTSILMRGQIPEMQQQDVKEAAPEQRSQRYTEQKDDLVDHNQQAAANQDTRETARQQKTQPIIKDKMPGRNDPCPCGSGKKFKNCHGRGL